jgi:hypothetical protein
MNNRYGILPAFPVLYDAPDCPLTRAMIEYTARCLVDRANKIFVAERATPDEYEAWAADFEAWEKAQYEKIRRRWK